MDARLRQIGREIFALRINEGMSRSDLANRCGVSAETIRMAEAGFVPTPRIQFLIAKAYGKRPLELWPIEIQRKVAA